MPVDIDHINKRRYLLPSFNKINSLIPILQFEVHTTMAEHLASRSVPIHKNQYRIYRLSGSFQKKLLKQKSYKHLCSESLSFTHKCICNIWKRVSFFHFQGRNDEYMWKYFRSPVLTMSMRMRTRNLL